MAIKLFSRGAAGEVTGSKHIIDTGASRILLDCGAFQGKRKESDQKNRDTDFHGDHYDAVVLSHAHYDHCGLLPLLSKSGYRGNIYSTAATRDLANIIMMDSAKIQARDAEYLTKQARKRNEKFEWKPLFDEQDVIQTMTQFVTVSYEREILVAPDVSVLFSDAGHILGSSTVRLRIHTPGQNENDSVDVVFSGDLGRPDRPIIRDPAPLPPADYLILESTYGDRLHEKSADVLPRLAAIVRQTVERGGRIVIPAFAVERTQDIVYYLHLLVQRNEIPKVPIYVDSPMATDATAIFKLHPECYDRETYEAFTARHQDPFGFASLHYIQSVAESKELNDGNDPMIIISASGMCESGRIQHHLLHTLADPRNTVLLVGFMARHTLGRKLQERAKEVRILDTTVPVRAHIEEINALSGHADYGEIRELVTAMSLDRLRRIFLVHGEDTALSHQKLVLEQAGVGSVEIVEYGSTYTLS